MKKILFVFLLNVSYLKAQENNEHRLKDEPTLESRLLVDGELPIDSFFIDKSNKLISKSILVFDSMPVKELVKKTKNWASTNFVNLKEILVSETEDQMVLNYIDKSFFYKTLGIQYQSPWYIRLVIKFKNGKIKCEYFDDGNVFSKNVPARTIFLNDCFKTRKDKTYARGTSLEGLLKLKTSIGNNIISLQDFITKKEIKNDW